MYVIVRVCRVECQKPALEFLSRHCSLMLNCTRGTDQFIIPDLLFPNGAFMGPPLPQHAQSYIPV